MARPKLKPGEKGNYNVSRNEQAKRKIKRKIQATTKTVEKLRTKAKNKVQKNKKTRVDLNGLTYKGVKKLLTETKKVKNLFGKLKPPTKVIAK